MPASVCFRHQLQSFVLRAHILLSGGGLLQGHKVAEEMRLLAEQKFLTRRIHRYSGQTAT